MNILKIAEVLESYSEDVLAYKLDGGFANAVTEAVSLLISQGEQIADLENKLATVNGGWIPTSLGLYPDKQGTYLCLVKFPEAKEGFPHCLNWHAYGYNGFISRRNNEGCRRNNEGCKISFFPFCIFPYSPNLHSRKRRHFI